MDDARIIETTLAIAREAGALVREAFPQTALDRVDLKSAVDPVTETDRASEALILKRAGAAARLVQPAPFRCRVGARGPRTEH